MFLKSANKVVTTVVLSAFFISSTVPSIASNDSIENLIEREAVFGWCKLKRMKKKTKRLLKSIEEYKEGEKAVEEVTYEIASLKRTANKAFNKNIKVHKIMQLANRKIEEFMYSLMNEGAEQVKNKFEATYAKKAKSLGSYDLQNQYESINLFLSDLQYYEDNEDNTDYVDHEDYDESLHFLAGNFSFFKELQAVTCSKGNSSRDKKDPEAEILFAYVSIFCGCLLAIIPTPFTRSAGASLISGGLYVLCQDEWVSQDENNKNKQKESK